MAQSLFLWPAEEQEAAKASARLAKKQKLSRKDPASVKEKRKRNSGTVCFLSLLRSAQEALSSRYTSSHHLSMLTDLVRNYHSREACHQAQRAARIRQIKGRNITLLSCRLSTQDTLHLCRPHAGRQKFHKVSTFPSRLRATIAVKESTTGPGKVSLFRQR